jgi:predicted Zn-dependent protease
LIGNHIGLIISAKGALFMVKTIHRYSIGIMEMLIEEKTSDEVHAVIEGATARVQEALSDVNVDLSLIRVPGQHLTPEMGSYSPIDYLQIGMSEKIEREVNFIVIVTEVELSASGMSYVLGFSSRLTNIGIISMKRLAPDFWGEPSDPNTTTNRLAALMLHTIGHLLNLDHHEDSNNFLYDFSYVEDLDKMQNLTVPQINTLRSNLPVEAHEEIAYDHITRFAARQLIENFGYILRSALRANPLKLLTRLPTMATTAASVIIVLFFSSEVWDVAGSVDLYQLVLFGIIAIVGATLLLYQVFSLGPLLNRRRGIAESTIVTVASTLLSLILTLVLLYLIFFVLVYLGIITIFPVVLMRTWPSIDPAVKFIDHIRLSAFISGMGVLAGSLGGRADSRNVMRGALFFHEET